MDFWRLRLKPPPEWTWGSVAKKQKEKGGARAEGYWEALELLELLLLRGIIQSHLDNSPDARVESSSHTPSADRHHELTLILE